jgi:hypothetical protein
VNLSDTAPALAIAAPLQDGALLVMDKATRRWTKPSAS